MKRLLAIIMTVVLVVSLASGCSKKQKKSYLVTENFNNQNVGIIKDKTDIDLVKKEIGNPKIKTYSDAESGIKALRKSKIQGLVLDATTAKSYVKSNNDLVLLVDEVEKKNYVIPIRNSDLNEPNYYLIAGATLSKLKGDGTYDKILAKYFGGKAAPYTFQTNYKKAPGRKLLVGVNANLPPFASKNSNGEITGFNIDIAREIAKDFAAELVIKEYPQDSLLKALENKEVALVLSNFKADDIVSKNLLLSDSYFDASTYIVILSNLKSKISVKTKS